MSACNGCGYTPYTFSSVQAVKTLDWMRFCSPACERNPNIEQEHALLKDAVVEAAKADRLSETAKTGTNADFDEMVKARRAFRAAVTALIAFEAEHRIEESR